MEKDKIIEIINRNTKLSNDGYLRKVILEDKNKLAFDILAEYIGRIGELEAKVTAYEAILNNSNFKMAVAREIKGDAIRI